MAQPAADSISSKPAALPQSRSFIESAIIIGVSLSLLAPARRAGRCLWSQTRRWICTRRLLYQVLGCVAIFLCLRPAALSDGIQFDNAALPRGSVPDPSDICKRQRG